MIQLDQFITLNAEGEPGVPSIDMRGEHNAAQPADFLQVLAAVTPASTSPQTPPALGIDLTRQGSRLPVTVETSLTASIPAAISADLAGFPHELAAVPAATISLQTPPPVLGIDLPVHGSRLPVPVETPATGSVPAAVSAGPAAVSAGPADPESALPPREPQLPPVVTVRPRGTIRETPPPPVQATSTTRAEHDASVLRAGYARPDGGFARDADTVFRDAPVPADVRRGLETVHGPDGRRPEPAAQREQPAVPDGRRPGQAGQSAGDIRARVSLVTEPARADRVQAAAGELPRPVQGAETPSVPHVPGPRSRPADAIPRMPADRPDAPLGDTGRSDFAAIDRQVVRTETAPVPMSPDSVRTESALDRVSQAPATSAVAAPPAPGRNEGPANGRIFALPAFDLPMQVTDSEWRDTLGSRVAMLAGRNIGAAELRMNPAELGPVHVQVSVEDNVAKIAFSATHSLTREQLELALPRLREMLEEQGMRLGDASVSDRRGGDRAGSHDNHATGDPESPQNGVAADTPAAAAVPVQLGPAAGRVDTYA